VAVQYFCERNLRTAKKKQIALAVPPNRLESKIFLGVPEEPSVKFDDVFLAAVGYRHVN
jgi:hypothetical protein